MKMRSMLVPLLLVSGSALYAMRFPLFPILENQSYESLVTHAQSMLKPLPAQIKQAQDRLQNLLEDNPKQHTISQAVDELIRLYLQKLEMDLTLTYVDRATRFKRLCDQKTEQQKAEIAALHNQEPLRATTGVELGSYSSTIQPETVMPEQIAPKPSRPVATGPEEDEEATKPTPVADEESEDGQEESEEGKQKLEKEAAARNETYASKSPADSALYQAQIASITKEAKELKEQEKEGTAPVGWWGRIKQRYQEVKDWYFGTGEASPQTQEE